jgi:DUF438 domain-containing protein
MACLCAEFKITMTKGDNSLMFLFFNFSKNRRKFPIILLDYRLHACKNCKSPKYEESKFWARKNMRSVCEIEITEALRNGTQFYSFIELTGTEYPTKNCMYASLLVNVSKYLSLAKNLPPFSRL